MKITFHDYPEVLREQFISAFLLSSEEIQAARMYLWDRLAPTHPMPTFAQALDTLRGIGGPVLFMSESRSHPYPGVLWLEKEPHVDFVAEADAAELADLIEAQWRHPILTPEEIRSAVQPVLPEDLYIFDPDMKWFIIFTHTEIDWPAGVPNPMPGVQNRFCRSGGI